MPIWPGLRRSWGVAMDNRRDLPGYKYYPDARGARPDVFVAYLDLVAGARRSGRAGQRRLPAGRRGHAGAARPPRAQLRAHRRVDRVAAGRWGARVWAYIGRAAARERLAEGRRTGTAVIDAGYVRTVEAGFAVLGDEELAAVRASLDARRPTRGRPDPPRAPLGGAISRWRGPVAEGPRASPRRLLERRGQGLDVGLALHLELDGDRVGAPPTLVAQAVWVATSAIVKPAVGAVAQHVAQDPAPVLVDHVDDEADVAGAGQRAAPARDRRTRPMKCPAVAAQRDHGEAGAARHPDRGRHPHDGGGGEPADRVAAHEDQATADEPQPGDDLRGDARRVQVDRPPTSTSLKPYLLMITNSAAPTPTSVCVRSPADFWRHSRSSPISDESPKASASSAELLEPLTAGDDRTAEVWGHAAEVRRAAGTPCPSGPGGPPADVPGPGRSR